MRFDELVLRTQDDELRLRFHPELTVLSGLGVLERQSLADSILAALSAGEQTSALRYTDGTGRAVTLVCADGRANARHDDDGSAAATPIGSIAPSPSSLRSLLLVRASDLGTLDAGPREDEPPELTEARATLRELTNELDDALRLQQAQTDLRSRLNDLDEQIAIARDGQARREYAQVLAQLERVRAEAAAVQSTAAGIETDRKLLSAAPAVHELAQRWRAAAARLEDLEADLGPIERLAPSDLAEAVTIPDEAPPELSDALAAVQVARADRDALDVRLQDLAAATLPAPSDPLVADLGVLDQDELWGAAERLTLALDEIERLQVAHGGLGVDDAGPGSAVLDRIESAHSAVEDAERAAEAKRVPGVAASGLGVALALAGALWSAVLIAIGLILAVAAGIAMLVIPKRKVAEAAAREREALAQADATSYLGFHIRRVDASVDPQSRDRVAMALIDQRKANAAWEELVGAGVDVRRASALEQEVRSYREALRSLGGAADEIEQLRHELAEQAEPALATAMGAVRELCDPYGVHGGDLAHHSTIDEQVAARVEVGRIARLQVQLEEAEEDEHKYAGRLDDLLLQAGFGDGELEARAGSLEWAVSQAAERERSRAEARPLAELEAEQRRLEAAARSLRQPEWDTVTAADAEAPDLAALEAERDSLAGDATEVLSELDVERLADRQAAIERRVAALEARHGSGDGAADPAALADLHQHLLDKLTAAATAGPHDDPVPMVLDEALHRVPADRKWDSLDLLLRQSQDHQLIYLSDDAFVAAWARQQAADGRVVLLEA